MWQVSGRSDITDFEEVVRLDKEYIENWDIGLDIKILLKTVMVVAKDNTLALCKKLENDDKRIILVDKKNGGVSKARNEGIKKATGKWVVYLDSDDYLCKGAFEKFRKIESNVSGFDIVIFNYIVNSVKMSQQEYAFLNGDSRICNKEKEDIIISCLSNKLAGNAKAPINIGVP